MLRIGRGKKPRRTSGRTRNIFPIMTCACDAQPDGAPSPVIYRYVGKTGVGAPWEGCVPAFGEAGASRRPRKTCIPGTVNGHVLSTTRFCLSASSPPSPGTRWQPTQSVESSPPQVRAASPTFRASARTWSRKPKKRGHACGWRSGQTHRRSLCLRYTDTPNGARISRNDKC